MEGAGPLPSKRVLLSAGAFLLVMMVIGSVWDYPISRALYNQSNVLGLFFAAFGEYPAALGFAAAGAMLISARNREKRLRGVLQALAGCVLLLFGAAMAAVLPTGYLDISLGLSAVIGIACTALAVWGILRLCRDADRGTVLRVAAVFLLAGVLVGIGGSVPVGGFCRYPGGESDQDPLGQTPDAACGRG